MMSRSGTPVVAVRDADRDREGQRGRPRELRRPLRRARARKTYVYLHLQHPVRLRRRRPTWWPASGSARSAAPARATARTCTSSCATAAGSTGPAHDPRPVLAALGARRRHPRDAAARRGLSARAHTILGVMVRAFSSACSLAAWPWRRSHPRPSRRPRSRSLTTGGSQAGTFQRAAPRPRAASTRPSAPRHPFMAPNGRSNIHSTPTRPTPTAVRARSGAARRCAPR